MTEERRYWLTVREAAKVVRRAPVTVYTWIERGHLTTRTDEKGITRVEGRSLIEAEASMKRGWPKGKTRRPSPATKPE
jgi:YD repeat-containing protein